MTISELISKLQQYPSDMQVIIDANGPDECSTVYRQEAPEENWDDDMVDEPHPHAHDAVWLE